jgi:hypothetical protein
LGVAIMTEKSIVGQIDAIAEYATTPRGQMCSSELRRILAALEEAHSSISNHLQHGALPDSDGNYQ